MPLDPNKPITINLDQLTIGDQEQFEDLTDLPMKWWSEQMWLTKRAEGERPPIPRYTYCLRVFVWLLVRKDHPEATLDDLRDMSISAFGDLIVRLAAHFKQLKAETENDPGLEPLDPTGPPVNDGGGIRSERKEPTGTL